MFCNVYIVIFYFGALPVLIYLICRIHADDDAEASNNNQELAMAWDGLRPFELFESRAGALVSRPMRYFCSVAKS